jgi:hypothetical protein
LVAAREIIMRRVWFGLAVLMLGVASAPAQDAASRKEIIDGMRRGYLQAAQDPNAPNLFDVLESRYAADLDRLADAVNALRQSGTAPDSNAARQLVARTLVEVQQRDGDHIKRAPAESLKRVITAQRTLIQAASRDKPDLCVAMVAGGPSFASPSKAIAHGSAERLIAVLAAVADGRDKPVTGRADPADADYEALAADAVKRGQDVASWAVIDPEAAQTAPAAKVCSGLISLYESILAIEGEAGDRILGEQVQDFVIKDMNVYQNFVQ